MGRKTLPLRQQWEKKVKIARRYSVATKIRIGLSFAMTPLSFLPLVEKPILALLQLFPLIISWVVFYRELTRYDRICEWPGLNPPSPESAERLELTLGPLIQGMGIERSDIVVLISSDSKEFIPSIVQDRKGSTARLLLPLSFLKLMSIDPDVGRSILAHELSHVAQRDGKLWNLAKAFGKCVLYIDVPFSLVAGIVSLAAIAKPESPYLILYPFVLAGRPLSFYYSVTKMCRNAELAADLGSAAFAGIDLAHRALKAIPSALSRTPFPLHPARWERIAALEEASATAGCPASSVGPGAGAP